MLETLAIQNFQTHGKTRITFDPGITCIVGPSDVGKSAVLRALRWVCTNEPGGDAFISHGAKGATVRLAVDGQTITRRRSPGGTVNEYHLNDQEFKAFGRGIPEPIQALLSLGPVCWQGQHDAPYWFADTAGEVSRQLNSIVNLGIIDDVLGKVAAARNRARTRLDVAEENLDTAKRDHTALGWVEGFAAAVGGVVALEAAHTTTTARAVQARELVAEAISTAKTKDNAAGVAQAGDVALRAGATALEKRQASRTLAGLVGQAYGHQTAINAARVPDMAALDAAYINWKTKQGASADATTLLTEAISKRATVCQAERELKAAEKELPSLCPVCGR